MNGNLIITVICLIIINVLLHQSYCQRLGDQFNYGVMSIDATSTSILLWTRSSKASTSIRAQLSTSPTFEIITKESSNLTAVEGRDFTVRVQVDGLAPNTLYYYRFMDGSSSVSDTGKFKSAPLKGRSEDVYFAWTGDSDGARKSDGTHWYGNDFDTLGTAAAEPLDFFVFLGDTIYADSFARKEVADDENLEDYTVTDYWNTYKLNREYENYRNILASTSSFVQSDDHEVYDDYYLDLNISRIQNAFQAFDDYFTFRSYTQKDLSGPTCVNSPTFRYFQWGEIDIIILDVRACRSGDVTACRIADTGVHYPFPLAPNSYKLKLTPGLGGIFRNIGNIPDLLFGDLNATPDECVDGLLDANRTMLGQAQKEEFLRVLGESTATFKLVFTGIPMQEWLLNPYDRWEAYTAERREILTYIRDNDIGGVVFFTTDVHLNLINDVYIDVTEDNAVPVAKEFIVGPVAYRTLNGIVEAEVPAGKLVAPGVREYFNDVLSTVNRPLCRQLETYAYGTVRYNSTSQEITVELKDGKGNVIIDEDDETTPCSVTLGLNDLERRLDSGTSHTTSSWMIISLILLLVVYLN
jgi:alkaline phosphatase D